MTVEEHLISLYLSLSFSPVSLFWHLSRDDGLFPHPHEISSYKQRQD